MASLEEIRAERLKKLRLLEKDALNPYPASAKRERTLAEMVADFEKLSKKKFLVLAGRVMSLRPQGGLIFCTLDDGTGCFQGLIKKDSAGDKVFDFFSNVVDIGDFIEASGSLFLTKRNEKTLEIKKWRMLAKSLRPLPEKWHGLTDTEERFRRRYLDLLMSPEVKGRFILRSRLIAAVRKFYDSHGYLEVETPRLQTLAGGATARPFVTHHNALDLDFHLTIAQELYLKELLVGGFNKVYEIGRKFRNEGIDVTHNPEFTMLESNEAYVDAKAQREFTEKLFKTVVAELFGKTTLTYNGETVDFGKPFAVMTFYELLKRHGGISKPESARQDELLRRARELKLDVGDAEPEEKIFDAIYKKTCRPKLIRPTFIVDYPTAFNPFAKTKEGDPKLIDRFQLVAGGLELVNAFSEINNPLDQKERYAEQEKKRAKGDEDISPNDKAYLEAMEYGMPPCGGIGIGIDRVTMLFTDTKNIKEVILFPTLRPKKDTA